VGGIGVHGFVVLHSAMDTGFAGKKFGNGRCVWRLRKEMLDM
jgi:hypothetical protein